jgi:tRNA(Ile)-lysidine synthase
MARAPTPAPAHLRIVLPDDVRCAVVAVSGGPDSVALVDLLVAARLPNVRLVVAHADHGIHPESARVADRVAALAARYALPFELGRLGLGPGTSETTARSHRYAWLEGVRLAHAADAILTAHHADDQAETVLMRLLAGSAPAGLAAMQTRSGRIVRPLLSYRRDMLARYVQERDLEVWHDPANDDPAHLRSWTRRQLLPVLGERIPDVAQRLGRVARYARADREAWEAVLDEMVGLDCRTESDGISVAAHPLRGYDSALALAVLRAAARRAGCVLGPVRARRLLRAVQAASSGATIELGGVWRAELTFGRLRIHPAAAPVAGPVELDGEGGERQWDRWRLSWRLEPAPARQTRGALSAWFRVPLVPTLRGWRAGDRVRPLHGLGRRPVVRCFQDARVPRSQRAGWPVLEENGVVLWVPGVCRSDGAIPDEGSEALRVDATYA